MGAEVKDREAVPDDDGRESAYRRDMPVPPRRWREPPIFLQILLLLLGGLVVAQIVTLLLTLVFPPAPPIQHRLSDVAAALRGAPVERLVRRVDPAVPAIGGPGWFTSGESTSRLARMLDARDADVRLAFYAPLPFAGTTSMPPRITTARPVAWTVAPEPIETRAMRLQPISLMIDGQGPPPGGGPGGGGFQPSLPGGFPGGERGRGPFPGGMRSSGISQHGDAMGQDRGIGNGRPSPGDLDRQPIAPPAGGRSPGDTPPPNGADTSRPNRSPIESYPGGRVPTEGFDPRMFGLAGPASPAVPSETPQARPAETEEPEPQQQPERRPAAPLPASAEPIPFPPLASVQNEGRAITPAATFRVAPLIEAMPAPIATQAQALFGLAPAPFVEGDFVAARRLPDGRWIVVQPAAATFPNAWQRRVLLWFAIAFAVVAPIGWLFARRIARPLARFTAAAETLGRDPSAALVPLSGPGEIGRAANAFNIMQSRLRSFVDDRTAMVGAISHDLRTPLTRMRFRIEEVDDDSVRDGIAEEIAEMEAMIGSVLDFIRDASTPNVRERMDLALLVEDVAQDAALVGGDVVVEALDPAIVEIDVLGMRRLLANLVENAVKYGVRARISLAADGETIVAAVHDDGPGIPEDELERAFEPFYRASNAEASGKTGTGLGLAVCRSIARAHGGDVRLTRSADGFSAELLLPRAYESQRRTA